MSDDERNCCSIMGKTKLFVYQFVILVLKRENNFLKVCDYIGFKDFEFVDNSYHQVELYFQGVLFYKEPFIFCLKL